MSEIKVNSIKGVGASTAAITVNNTDGTCTANITNNLSNRRLTINGDMRIAQRGTSSTSNGYQTVDRMNFYTANTGVTVTQSQQSLASSDTPYTLGFRNFYRIALSGAGTANSSADVGIFTTLEAQDIANSGWNYTSTSSFITLQFWFRCSTNQTFYCYLLSKDGTEQSYPFSFTASGNNAWTKITKTIPGNSNLTFDNNNEQGLTIVFVPFFGTDLTGNKTLDQWSAFSASNRIPDMASTWLTAGASTFDLTGLQLEVGSVATDFEHRSFGQELALCQRYFYMHTHGEDYTGSGDHAVSDCFTVHSNTLAFTSITPPVTMRAKPTLYTVANTGYFKYYNPNSNQTNITSIQMDGSTSRTSLGVYVGGSFTAGQAILVRAFDSNARLGFSAEL